ncbi:MAG: amidohydrolase [Alphaproteobacteria bacterium CG_4_9_14_3_um_filter_47_13]|nr:MAG: amidohydrolase [Alphaproteobacteria bacterium CG_4_9_14_3_um_filter_47_13]
MVRTACIQLNSGAEIQPNLEAAASLIRQAAEQGAQFIATPENSCHMRARQEDRLETSMPEETHRGVPFFSKLAQEYGIWLLVGSMSIRLEGGHLANRSFLFNDKGALLARYDKIHLFDVDLPTGESHRESNLVKAGTEAVTVKMPWGTLGMSICYDLRFSYLYRDLARAGASILAVPAAFTVPTGQAHWDVLLRARAIETGSFVVAPAQCGTHEGGRKTYGHSMIISPWGEILAEGDAEPGIIIADLDLSEVSKARQAIPALQHDRDYLVL